MLSTNHRLLFASHLGFGQSLGEALPLPGSTTVALLLSAQEGEELTHLFAVLQDLDLVRGARGLVVEVSGPLAAAAEVLVVEEVVGGIALLRRAHHGHHGVVMLALRRRRLK